MATWRLAGGLISFTGNCRWKEGEIGRVGEREMGRVGEWEMGRVGERER